jgi:hypothetical protein
VAALPLAYGGRDRRLAFYHNDPHEYLPDERILAGPSPTRPPGHRHAPAARYGGAHQAGMAVGLRRHRNGLALVDAAGRIERGQPFPCTDLAGVPVTELPGSGVDTLFVDWPQGEAIRCAGPARSQRVSAFLDTRKPARGADRRRADGGFVVAVDDLTHTTSGSGRYSRLVETAHDAIVLAGPDGGWSSPIGRRRRPVRRPAGQLLALAWPPAAR